MTILNIAAVFFGYTLLMSLVLLVVMSGIGYNYFNSEIMLYSIDVNLKVLFGCGIGVGLLLLLIVWIFFGFPKLFINYVVTFPLIVVMCSLYTVYTRPSQVVKYHDLFSIVWTAAAATSDFQIKLKCCGWFNASDRGISACPINYDSGCSKLLMNYLEPRFNEIFVSSIVILAMAFVSVVMLLILYFISNDESIIELFRI